MVRRRKQKKNKGGADWTAKGTPSGASTASLVKEDETMGNVIRKSKEVFGRGKDLLVGAIFNNPEQSPGIGGRRKKQKGGGETEDLIGKPVGEEECQKNVRMPTKQKGGNKNKYEGCGGDVFKGLYGGGKRKSRRSTKMRRTRRRRGSALYQNEESCRNECIKQTGARVGTPVGEKKIQKCMKNVCSNFSSSSSSPSSSSGVGGKRRRRRRTKRRKSKRRRKSRRKSRRRKHRRSRSRKR
jgi:hypothetical protein